MLHRSAERDAVCGGIWTSEVAQCTLTPSLCPQGIMLLFMGVTASHGLGHVPLLPLERREQLL